MQLPSFADIIDPGRYSIDEAEQVARQLMADGQKIPERLAMALNGQPPPDAGRAERMLGLLPRITGPERLLPLLDRLMPSSNSRIRSKAWKLYTEASADLGWAKRQVEDPDARVAANVIEALWRATPSEPLRELFFQAAQQERNRVAGNGLVGLLVLRDPRANELLAKMAKHDDARFRATAAWVVGRGCWRDGAELLRDLRTDNDKRVRLHAKRSSLRLTRLRPLEMTV